MYSYRDTSGISSLTSRRNYGAEEDYGSGMSEEKSEPTNTMSQSAYSRRSASRDYSTADMESGDTSLLAQRLAAGKSDDDLFTGSSYMETESTGKKKDSELQDIFEHFSEYNSRMDSYSLPGETRIGRSNYKSVTASTTSPHSSITPPTSTALPIMPSWDTEKGESSGIPSSNQSGFNMSSSTTGGKLVQEIHEEFLVCKICLEGYKNPKSLNCLHTFCENCIENHVMSESTYKKYSDYREFTCPLCRKRTQLPIGGVKKLPDNFLVSSLSEMLNRQKPSKFPFCDICKLVNHKHREASSKCLDCAKLLCKQCVEMHRETKVTANHSIFDVEIEKDIECKEHQDEVVRFYCEPCETCICVLCTFNEHRDHEITQFGEAIEKYKDNIASMLECCKAKIQKFDDQIDSLNIVEEIIKESEQKVHDTAIQFISDIRHREKLLIDELRNLYGKDLMEYIENKKDLSATVDGLRSTCNLTEVILKGKDIELLLLKKDVQKKLSSLSDIEIKNLPSTINKKVTYLPGSIDLGVMQDSDRPMLSKMRTKKIGSVDNTIDGMEFVQCSNVEVQTDLKHTDIRLKKDESETEGDEETEEESEEESDEDSEDEKPKKEFKDAECQYEKQDDTTGGETEEETEESEDEEKPEMVDCSTTTEHVSTEEKGVNTRSRSLQSLSHLNRRSPPKDNENDSSLAARRRRRRERAATTQIGTYQDVPDTSDSYQDDIYADRRKPRGGMRYNYTRSMDDEVFYDGVEHHNNTTAY